MRCILSIDIVSVFCGEGVSQICCCEAVEGGWIAVCSAVDEYVWPVIDIVCLSLALRSGVNEQIGRLDCVDSKGVEGIEFYRNASLELTWNITS